MTSQTATRPYRWRSRVRNVLDTDLAAIVVSLVLALSIGTFVARGPAFVDQVSVTNPSEYDVGVQVSGGNRDGWMAVTTASRHSTTTTVDVVDQGDVWIFRFNAQDREGGELRVARHDLEQAGWTITVPDEVIEHLRNTGAPLPP